MSVANVDRQWSDIPGPMGPRLKKDRWLQYQQVFDQLDIQEIGRRYDGTLFLTAASLRSQVDKGYEYSVDVFRSPRANLDAATIACDSRYYRHIKGYWYIYVDSNVCQGDHAAEQLAPADQSSRPRWRSAAAAGR